MRLFETILILSIVAAAITQMTKIAVSWSLPLTLLAVLLSAWHVVREGSYWQMFPSLIGVLVLVALQVGPTRLYTAKARLALAVVLFCLISLGLLLLVPMF